jgi:hypothetical protein
MQRNRRLIERLIRQFTAQQRTQALRVCDVIAQSEQPQQRTPGKPQHFLGGDPAPEGGHPLDGTGVGIVREERAIDGTRGHADDHVRPHAGGDELREHSHLNGSQTTASSEHERRPSA